MTNFKQLRNRSITALHDSSNLLIRSQKLLLLADQLNKELFDKLKEKGVINKWINRLWHTKLEIIHTT